MTHWLVGQCVTVVVTYAEARNVGSTVVVAVVVVVGVAAILTIDMLMI
jgi:hypothetical protein